MLSLTSLEEDDLLITKTRTIFVSSFLHNFDCNVAIAKRAHLKR